MTTNTNTDITNDTNTNKNTITTTNIYTNVKFTSVLVNIKLRIYKRKSSKFYFSVAKSAVLKRASPFKRAFGGNRPFFARFSVISPVFVDF